MKSDEAIDAALGFSEARDSAERQLLDLVREADSAAFEMKLMFSDGRWTLVMDHLENGIRSVGQGESFAEAWHLQEGTFFKNTK